jgi:hypothetical protein
MWFLGIDWGEAHHDLCLLDQDGMVLGARRIAHGLAGVGELHALVAAHAEDPTQVAVRIETDRGLLVGALLAAGYQIYSVNPQVVSRYRGRHGSQAKSDRGDAKVLADLVRTDRHNHRQVAGDSPLAEAVKLLARAHQSLLWARQRHLNVLRSALREFYPGGLAALGAQLAEPEALAVLALAPTPELGRRLTRAAVRQARVGAGRRRHLQAGVVAVHDALSAPQLAAPAPMEAPCTEVIGALVGHAALPEPAGGLTGATARGSVRRSSGRGNRAQPARARSGAGRTGAGRVRRRPIPVCHRQGPQGLRRHRPCHPILGAAQGGGRPGGL